ncbi:MAG: hypothetical protein SXG53_18610 [Pseudomonadota bacterium]|nr:hypothetical protein [Pseudomonadota bacterium]
MIGDIIGEVAGGALKFVGRILFEVVFEFLIKGAGYVLCRPFARRKVDPDGGLVVVVGLVFWVVVSVGIYAIKRQV